MTTMVTTPKQKTRRSRAGGNGAATGIGGAVISVGRPSIVAMEVTLVGVTPLLTFRRTERAMAKIEGTKPGGKAVRQKSGSVTPEQEYLDSRYMIDEKTHGFPSSAVKAAMIDAVGMLREAKVIKLSKKAGKPMFTTYAPQDPRDLMRLKFKKVGMHKTIGVIPKTHAPIPVYRAIYTDWSARVVIRYDSNLLSAEEVVNLLAAAGQIGIGAWRPACNGSFGMFEIADV